MGKLSEKQKRFCKEYIIDLNQTQAAIRAGYSPKTAYSIGNENLKKPEIKKYIDELMKEISDKQIATADEVLKYLTGVMRNEDFEIKDRTKAAELLGKRHALFTEKIDGRIDSNIANKDNKAFKVDFSNLTTKEIKELLKDEDKG